MEAIMRLQSADQLPDDADADDGWAGTSGTGAPHIGRTTGSIDLSAAEAAAAAFLTALGIDLHPDSRRSTPRRMARAYAELLRSDSFELTTFPNEEGYDELVLARSIPLQSMCEHHMLPFTGVAHVGYLPGNRIAGLSKLARVVQMFARRPQVQERLTEQIAAWLHETLRPRGVGVVVEAEHLCMTLRGVRAPGGTTVTSSLKGQLRTDASSRAEFLALTTSGAVGHRRG
jgi:GTP cyclohydrolase I